MADSPELHEEILAWTKEQFADILKDSSQAIYIYVCDRHKICNKNFSSMLGYKSAEEWATKEDVVSDVIEQDQQILISAYHKAMEEKVGSVITISWKDQKGKFIKTQVILVPASFKGELYALHFITKM